MLATKWDTIHWRDDMSVGVAQLDDDHKGLIAILNRLGHALHGDAVNGEGGVPSRDDQRTVLTLGLRALESYMKVHFAREERAMQVGGFPGLDGHKPQHRDFIEEMTEMTNRFEAGGDTDLLEDLVLYLRDWLIHHIMVEDMTYKPYLAGNADAHRAAREFKTAGH